MKYRKKPVVIDAIQLLKKDSSIVDCIEFLYQIGMETSIHGRKITINTVYNSGGIIIDTLEGKMKACFDDYIIKGVKGEFYPCKSDIFEMTYEAVSEEDLIK